MTRVFQIGFNRCATRSIAATFRRSGYRATNWDENQLAIAIARRRARFEDPVLDYPGTQVFADMECVIDANYPLIEAYKYFDYLYAWHPDAYFILNTRHVDDWIGSRTHHRGYLSAYMRHYGTQCAEAVTQKWRIDWHEHHARVLRFFADKPGRLLEFDIDRDHASRIAKFVRADFALSDDALDVIGARWRPEDAAQTSAGEASSKNPPQD